MLARRLLAPGGRNVAVGMHLLTISGYPISPGNRHLILDRRLLALGRRPL